MTDARTGGGRLHGRRGLLLVLLAAVVGVVATWGVSTLLTSPAQRAAETRPPEPTVVTAQVSRRVVAQSLIFRGKVGASSVVPAVPSGPPPGTLKAVVTKAPVRAGDTVPDGGLVVEVSGRPVIALEGDIPAYRDLHTSDAGPDVAQLQHALVHAGHPVDDDHVGNFGDGTLRALGQLYARLGYPAPTVAAARELLFVPHLPLQVLSSTAAAGMDAGKADVMVAAGALTITATVDETSAALLRPGMKAALASEILGKQTSGRVTAVGKPAATSGAASGSDANGATVAIAPDKPLTGDWYGQDVRVTVTAASSKGPVLAVPITGVALSGDGRAKVVVDVAGVEHDVPVVVGVTGDGYAEVDPLDKGTLAAGDVVVVSAR